MLSVLICDDHPVVRRGLKAVLTSSNSVQRVGEAATALEALDIIRKDQHWDVVVVDISLPGMSGLELLKEVKRERPRLPVLVLSMHPEDQYAVRSIRAGASGYLSKDAAPDDLTKAIGAIVAGRKYLTPSVAESLIHELESPSDRQPHEVLSDREYQILCLIAAGKSVKQIAGELFLSVKTVSTYRRRSLEKLGLGTSAELIRYAFQHRLVEV